MGYLIKIWIGGGISFLIGALLLYLARKSDEENFIIQKATPLPLSLVNVRDDVWLRGEVECDSPLSPPHFSKSCIHYSYTLEERVRETYTDSEGNTKTRTKWVTRERDEGSTLFRLVQGEKSIKINGEKAEFRDLDSEVDRIGKWRHTLYYLPYPSPTISAVGSVGEEREELEPYANIPLMVTPQTRKKFIEASEKGETYQRIGGFVLTWLGAVAIFYGVFDWMAGPKKEFQFHSIYLLKGLAAGSGVLFVIWSVYTYNTLVAYRQRVENAWRQVDVDLKMRFNLIPQLVSTVKGHMKHEAKVLESVTRMRTEGTGGYKGLPLGGTNLPKLMESFQKLKSSPSAERERPGSVDELESQLKSELGGLVDRMEKNPQLQDMEEIQVIKERLKSDDSLIQSSPEGMTLPNEIKAPLAGFMLGGLSMLTGQMRGNDRSDIINGEGDMVDNLSGFFGLVEDYPKLKNDELIGKLNRELKAIEEKIAHGRKFYNEAVNEYNDNVMMFPNSILATLGGFESHDYFQATEEEKKQVQVDFERDEE